MNIESGRQAVFLGVQLVSELIELRKSRQGGRSESDARAALRQWRERRTAWWRHVEDAANDGVRIPLYSVATRFKLVPREVDILLLALAPLVDAEFLDAASSVRRDYFFRGIDVEFVMCLLFLDQQERFDQQTLLAADAPLLRHQLVVLRSVGTDITPHETEVRPTDAFANLILQRALLTGNLADYCTLSPGRHHWEQVIVPTDEKDFIWNLVTGDRRIRDRLDQWGFRSVLPGGRGVVILFAGPPGTGKTAFAHAVASRLERPVLTVRTSRLLSSAGSLQPLLAELFRVAKVADAVVLLDDCEILLSERHIPLIAFLESLDEHQALLVLTTNQPGRIDPAIARRITYRMDFDLPSPLLREQIWEVFLPPELPVTDSVDVPYLARTYEFSGATIRKTVLVALAQCYSGRVDPRQATSGEQPVLDMNSLCEAASAHMGAQFDELAIKATCDLTLNQLVLPEQQLQDIRETLAACRHHEHVLNRWGFGKRLTTGRGICVLFDGPPGTGKTLTAELIAAELRRPLYRVHVPQVVSKWVGETERNIAEIFTRARMGRAILLFDEADSLFGTRSAGSQTANDRYANMEVNYLLQEVERFDGIIMLTTNLYGNLDEALQRRLQFRVSFPMPGPTERARIWEILFPSEAPRSADVDFADLGRRFDLPGGHIKNALLRAAYRACDLGQPIGQSHLIAAAMAECRAQGKLIREPPTKNPDAGTSQSPDSLSDAPS